jgi:hypothetical protein
MICLCGSRTESPGAFDGAAASTKFDCWSFFLTAYRDTRSVNWVGVLHHLLSLWRKFHTETIRLDRFSLGTFGWTALILLSYSSLADGRSFCSLVLNWSSSLRLAVAYYSSCEEERSRNGSPSTSNRREGGMLGAQGGHSSFIIFLALLMFSLYSLALLP